jgi:hypothetical protein
MATTTATKMHTLDCKLAPTMQRHETQSPIDELLNCLAGVVAATGFVLLAQADAPL